MDIQSKYIRIRCGDNAFNLSTQAVQAEGLPQGQPGLLGRSLLKKKKKIQKYRIAERIKPHSREWNTYKDTTQW